MDEGMLLGKTLFVSSFVKFVIFYEVPQILEGKKRK